MTVSTRRVLRSENVTLFVQLHLLVELEHWLVPIKDLATSDDEVVETNLVVDFLAAQGLPPLYK